jgi:hypothetical protein
MKQTVQESILELKHASSAKSAGILRHPTKVRNLINGHQ